MKKLIRRGRLDKFVPLPTDSEKAPTLPSETIPGQALSLPDLLFRLHAGTLTGVAERQPRYGDDDGPLNFDSHDMEDIARLDLAERAELLKQNAMDIAALKKRKAENDKALSDKEEREFAERVKKAAPKEEPATTKKSIDEPLGN